MTELLRFLRHAIAPLAALAVTLGWLPEYMQEDVTEALVLALGFVIPLAWSRWNDR